MEESKTAIPTEAHTAYLIGLRESGATNMWGAQPFLMAAFPDLTKQEASEVLLYWMKHGPYTSAKATA